MTFLTPVYLLGAWAFFAGTFYWSVRRLYIASIRKRSLAGNEEPVEAYPAPRPNFDPTPPAFEDVRPRQRARSTAYTIAGISQGVLCALVLLLVVHPESFGGGPMITATAMVVAVPFTLHGLVLLTGTTFVGASGLGPFSVIYGFVLAMFAVVTADYLIDPRLMVVVGLSLQLLFLVVFTLMVLAAARTAAWLRRLIDVGPLGAWLGSVWFGSAVASALIFGLGGGSKIGALLMLATHAVFWIVALAMTRPLAKSIGATELLFLRTLSGSKDHRPDDRLLRRLSRMWAEIGPIRLLAGSDTAIATTDADSIFAWMSGSLSRRVLAKPEDVRSRIRVLRTRPTRDGLHPVESFICAMPVWKMTVAELMSRSQVVLMDLRAFSGQNRGCIFEIEALGRIAPRSITFLVNEGTDRLTLAEVLARSFANSHAYRIVEIDANPPDSRWQSIVAELAVPASSS